MTDTHPDEVDLFSYVEDDLGATRRDAVAAHVAACERCAADVRRLEAAREALRTAPLLELPPTRRQALMRELPPQPGRVRSPALSPKRLLAVLTPVAAVFAVVLVLTTGDDVREFGGGAGGGGAAQERAVPEAAGAEDSAAAPPASASAAPAPSALRLVAGPPERTAAFLRKRGYDARALKGSVRVRDVANVERLRRALLTLPPGPVPVFAERVR